MITNKGTPSKIARIVGSEINEPIAEEGVGVGAIDVGVFVFSVADGGSVGSEVTSSEFTSTGFISG